MGAMAPPEGVENEYALQWNAPWEQAWVLSATVAEQDNFEAILRMIDWLYSDEAMVAMTFGEEGTTYKMEDGQKKFLDDTINYQSDYGLYENNLCVRFDVDYYNATLPQEVVDIYDYCTENNCIPPTNPASPLTQDQTDEISVVSSTLVDYVNASLEGFIFGTLDVEKDWDNFVKECENKGSKQLEEMYSEAWANK